MSEVSLLQSVDDGRGIVDQRGPLDEAGEDDRDADVKDGADDERGDDADGNVPLRVSALFAAVETESKPI